jgi:CRISPR-associated protein Cmr2
MAAGIRKLIENGGELIFPNPKGQPLLAAPSDWKALPDHKLLLTPNLPNLFVARLPSCQGNKLAKEIKQAIEGEWEKIAAACWNRLVENSLLAADEEAVFNDAVKRHLSIAWMVSPEMGDYAADYESNARQLDAVRQTRDFIAPAPNALLFAEKDSLTGVHASLVRPSDVTREKLPAPYRKLFKHDDDLGAITLIKRIWHLAFLQEERDLKTDSNEFPIRSTRAIAARSEELDDEDNTDSAPGEKYLAAIAFDGDAIGKWVSGEFLPPNGDLQEHHGKFSAALSDFALNHAAKIIENHKGFLVYSGGDDVLALVPADAALICAEALRTAFCQTTAGITGYAEKSPIHPDASAGIAIAHFKFPLQDLIREAQQAEKRAKREPAKDGLGRSAVAVTLMKRSGEISQWGFKWESGANGLYELIARKLLAEDLSARFPHRVCELLEPYLTQRTGLSHQLDADEFKALEIIEKEFTFAAVRQGSKELAQELLLPLRNYLSRLDPKPQTRLKALIGLCQTVAFTHRLRPRNATT